MIPEQEKERIGRPNILFILADEHRADCLGAYGNREIRTPCLDELARQGRRFDSCFCVYPVCTPSRYSILTGLYPHQHNAWSNHCTLGSGFQTFPKVLREEGYHTSCVGKMHFFPTYLNAGFDRMLLAEQDGGGRLEDDYHEELMRSGHMDHHDVMDQRREFRSRAPEKYWKTFGSGISDLPEDMHSTTWIGRNAVKQLEEWTAGGNLLMVGFIKPHHPFDPPARWRELYDERKLSLLPGWTDTLPEKDGRKQRPYFPDENMNADVMRRITACYYACISHMDWWIGEMIRTLKEKGLYENTLIVYTADHGDYMGFHHMLLKHNYMYDPVVRVPLIVRRPHETQPGILEERLVSGADIASGVLQWAGLDPRRVEGSPVDDTHREWVISEQRMNGNWEYMVRSRWYKALLSADETLLFDLESDPSELQDIAAECPEIVRRAKEALLSWLAFPENRNVYQDGNAPQVRSEEQKNRSAETVLEYYEKTFRADALE